MGWKALDQRERRSVAVTIAASVAAAILSQVGGWPSITLSILVALGALAWGFWPRINDTRAPNPVLSWMPEPQTGKFLVVVRNAGGRGRFSASAQIIEASDAEGQGGKGARLKLPWEGSEEIETEIGAGDFRHLRLAAIRPVYKRMRRFGRLVRPPGAGAIPSAGPSKIVRQVSGSQKTLSMGSKGAEASLAITREHGAEAMVRLTIETTPASAKPVRRTLTVSADWTALRVV